MFCYAVPCLLIQEEIWPQDPSPICSCPFPIINNNVLMSVCVHACASVYHTYMLVYEHTILYTRQVSISTEKLHINL